MAVQAGPVDAAVEEVRAGKSPFEPPIRRYSIKFPRVRPEEMADRAAPEAREVPTARNIPDAKGRKMVREAHREHRAIAGVMDR